MAEVLPVATCRLIEFPIVHDQRGNLTFIEGGEHVPFEIKRVYYLYDVPGGATRAGHAHKNLEQVIIAASGSFDVVVDDGVTRDTVTLNRSYSGLYIPTYVWRDLVNFSSGAVCLVLASDHFDESDYFRSYDEFLETVR
jgi:dTDP-4-dehydrorhamnose 3,5-epimerase-like enzyme